MNDYRKATALSMGAVAAASLHNRLPVVKVTIVPSGNAAGFVQYTPDDRLPTNADLELRLQVLLAGFTAESMFAERVTTASSPMLNEASRLAQQIKDNGDPREVHQILADARDKVRGILASNEGKVRRIADLLLTEGTLDNHALQQVIGGE